MKGCTHSPLAADVRGDTECEGSLNVSALVIPFRKSNFKLPQLKMFIPCLHFRVWQFERSVDEGFFLLLFCVDLPIWQRNVFYLGDLEWSASVAVCCECTFYCIHLRVWWAWLQLMVARKCNEGLPVTAGNLGAGDPCRLDSSKSKFSDLFIHYCFTAVFICSNCNWTSKNLLIMSAISNILNVHKVK